ncbi:MAG: pyridoxamine 5'-phosphate oxidase family protein [Eubacteriales bacterium]|nr:pyridoxamine 5'-phosphate oxidase family protein [Eubacteriales bacterium]
MFRKMRRFRQQLPEEEVIEILEQENTGILSVVGDGGYPYTIPINYVYEDGKIYLHGAKEGHKVDAIKQCDKVSFCVIERDEVVPEKLTTKYRSVIAFGRARFLETEEDIFHAAKILSLKYYDDVDFIEKEIRREWNGLSCIEIKIEHMTGKEGLELLKLRR